jgi:predicted amino acid racemase
MFVNMIEKRNRALLETTFKLHQEGLIEPDTYVVDVDSYLENAKLILEEAKKHNIHLYFMLKQIGRNPFLAKELVKLGYEGAVVVDFKEAKVMMKHNVPISNVGHLVQPCKSLIQKLVDYKCEYFTVYSVEKTKDINDCAKKSGVVQKLLLRVYDDNDMIYSAQTAGIHLKDLKSVVAQIKELKNVEIKGVTSFPCFLYDQEKDDTEPTNNLYTVLKANEILSELGINVENINAPSTTSVNTICKMVEYNVTSGEPGHGLSGTTPIHATKIQPEIPCVIYLSEISHNFMGNAYAFGGGHYRRSHIENALVGLSADDYKKVKVIKPVDDSIDYHFGLNEECNINDTVIMAFRFQIFVTRSNVCLIQGISSNKPKIVGVYNSLGDEIIE